MKKHLIRNAILMAKSSLSIHSSRVKATLRVEASLASRLGLLATSKNSVLSAG